MKILHTSDWHLGATLGMEKRTDEFRRTLDWLTGLLAAEKIEAMILAGDVFDNGMPPSYATSLYYRFLMNACEAGVREMVIIGGNHDSASFLEAPKPVLSRLHIHVVAAAGAEDDTLIVPLHEADGSVACAVCAVPFLRDRDIRTAPEGESARDAAERRLLGVADYYRTVVERAKERFPGTPLIATGHFFATGGKAGGAFAAGSLDNIPVGGLPDEVDYYALGHLHTPQCVDRRDNVRYSGSLLRMSFAAGDAGKTVLVLESGDLRRAPREIAVPEFVHMECVEGDPDAVRARLEELKRRSEPSWVHIENTGDFESDLLQKMGRFCENSTVRVISARNAAVNPAVRARRQLEERKLQEIEPEELFRRVLDRSERPAERREALLEAFRDVVRAAREKQLKTAEPEP